jgi:hypothetical protein
MQFDQSTATSSNDATGYQEEDSDDLTPRTTQFEQPIVTPLNQPTATPYNPPLPPEHATTTLFCPGTTSIDQPATTPLKLAPPLVDRPLPAAAATDHSKEEDYQEEDGDDPTRPEIPDTEAESMAKNAIPVTPILDFLQEYESAQVSSLFRLTKEDSDATLAVRLCTEGKTTATRDHYWLFKEN